MTPILDMVTFPRTSSVKFYSCVTILKPLSYEAGHPLQSSSAMIGNSIGDPRSQSRDARQPLRYCEFGRAGSCDGIREGVHCYGAVMVKDFTVVLILDGHS